MPEDEQEEGGPAPRPGFRALLRDSWALYSGHNTTLLALFFPAFLGLSLIQAAILIPLAESSISDFVGAFIQVGVFFVLGGIVGSFAVALAALIADHERTGEPATIGAAWNRIRPLSREVLGAAFLAAVLAMAISFAGLQQILRPVFFGPPVIVHAIALEGLPLVAAWPRAKALLRGNWGRAVLYLAVISLGIGLVQGFTSTGIFEALGNLSDDAADFVIFGPVRGLLDGIMLPFLAVAMYVLYRQLEAEGAGEPSAPAD